MKPTEEQLPEISAEMENKTPQEILRWGWETYGDKLTMATAFGAEGCAIIAMLADITKDIYLFNLNTGYQFPETLATRDRLIEKYGIPIHLVGAVQSVPEMEAEHGGPIYGTNPDLCCHIRKVVPLSSALHGFESWISAIRRDQTPERAQTPIVGWDRKFQLVKINPLANWSKTDLWNYILENDVPYNPMHDLGYPSIGCWPCTKAVGAGEDDRAGRWAGTAKKECGLHVLNNEPAAVR
ncbi:MAG: phosphoadenylyl-sulfate reductase [Capsulimonas sp.]|uniref:phosphoadenylyl-sulfate reductase n=1 Tax=Capsulimonas sp. TaxID=2494211 RepID=UPI0032668F2F